MTDGHDGGKHGISWSGGGEPTPPTETRWCITCEKWMPIKHDHPAPTETQEPLGPPQGQSEQAGQSCARCFHQIEAFVQMCPAGGICVAAPTERVETSPLKPSTTLLVKLGSIIVHSEELISPTGHAFDKVALEQLMGDPEVKEWISEMDKMAFLPKKR